MGGGKAASNSRGYWDPASPNLNSPESSALGAFLIKAAGFAGGGLSAIGFTAVGLSAVGLTVAAVPKSLALGPIPQPVAIAKPAAGPPLPYAITPERRALLDTIRYAEGTWRGGRPEGYRVIYGGSLCSSLRRHPEQIVHRRYTSAAAGAYQFLPSTWKAVAKTLKLTNFEAPSQDMAALYLVQRRGVLGNLDRHGLNATTLAALAKEWASLPNRRGASHYGQPVKSSKELISFYNASLVRNRQPSQGA